METKSNGKVSFLDKAKKGMFTIYIKLQFKKFLMFAQHERKLKRRTFKVNFLYTGCN